SSAKLSQRRSPGLSRGSTLPGLAPGIGCPAPMRGENVRLDPGPRNPGEGRGRGENPGGEATRVPRRGRRGPEVGAGGAARVASKRGNICPEGRGDAAAFRTAVLEGF